MEKELIFPFIIFIVAIVGSIWTIIKTFVDRRRLVRTFDFDKIEPEKAKSIKATLIDKKVTTVNVGSIKYPKNKTVFLFVFKAENNKIKKLKVKRQVFDKHSVGKTGTLITYNGCFLDFE